MPATDRLLEKLRETLGEEAARDLVQLVAEAHTVNRAEVRELADVYLGRFDERLERRLAEYDARVQQRFVGLDAKIERQLAGLNAKMERQLPALNAKMEGQLAALQVDLIDRMSAQNRDLLRWLFVFWAGTIIPLAGLMIALVKL